MSELLDTQMLEELREIMEDEFPVLMDTFLSESEKQYQAIKTAWADSDTDLLRRSAHSLKGSCGNIGAATLQSQCATLEYAARDTKLDEIPQLVDQVGTSLVDVCEAVRNL